MVTFRPRLLLLACLAVVLMVSSPSFAIAHAGRD
jgi:hypothetical protein